MRPGVLRGVVNARARVLSAGEFFVPGSTWVIFAQRIQGRRVLERRRARERENERASERALVRRRVDRADWRNGRVVKRED